MNNNCIYKEIVTSALKNKNLLAILLDPDKITIEGIPEVCHKVKLSPATHIFIGGSTFGGTHLDEIILYLKENCSLPVLLFPGNPSQISSQADGILFLQLLSGRNTDYLIEYQVNAVPLLEKTTLEIISTGYILIESGKETAVERVSKTKPMSRDNSTLIVQTAKAGEYIGNKLIYLEAGSGALHPISKEIIEKVASSINIPLIVGGGIRTKKEIANAFNAGANLVVIGTAFENDLNFFDF
jgi:phosphoglycerol geranylgeranyltransferase